MPLPQLPILPKKDAQRQRTKLSSQEEKGFKEWYSSWSQIAGLDPNPDAPEHKYDYRGAFKARSEPQIDPNDKLYHWDSKFKDEDHPNRFVKGVDTKNISDLPSLPSLPKKETFNEQVITRPMPIPMKPIVGVERVPKGEEGQKGYAQVIEMPEQEVTATPLPSTPEAKRVREYVQTQRFYANQRTIPSIGGKESPEYQAGEKMEAIAEGIRRNPFVNPLAPTLGAIEGGIEGAKKIGEGAKDFVKPIARLKNLSLTRLPSTEQFKELQKIPADMRKGIMKGVLGSAEMALSTGLAMTPAVNYAFGAAGEVSPKIMPFASPVSYLTKPTSEEGQVAAMIGDVIYQAGALKAIHGNIPRLVGRIQSKLQSKKLTPEEELFMTRQEAGDVRVKNLQYKNEGDRIEREIYSDLEAQQRARGEMEKELGRKLSDAEFEAKREQIRDYQPPPQLLTPQGGSEIVPSLLFDENGRPIPAEPVRSARAPLTEPEVKTTPFGGNPAEGVPIRARIRPQERTTESGLVLPPERLAEMTKELPPLETTQYFSKKDAPSNVKENFAKSDREFKEVEGARESVPKQEYTTLKDGTKVYLVDGTYIRNNLDVDFTMGGHEYVYPKYIPKGEIWLDKDINKQELDLTLRHEAKERNAMMGGKKYDDAHTLANKEEIAIRQGKKGQPLETKAPEVVESKAVEAVKTVDIPELKSTGDAIKFGREATPEQLTELAKKREEANIQAEQLRKGGDTNASLKKSVESQLYREAIEANQAKSVAEKISRGEKLTVEDQKVQTDYPKDVQKELEMLKPKADILKTPWVRGIGKQNAGRVDKFFSSTKDVASNYAGEVGEKLKYEKLSKEEQPKNPLVVNDKTELAEQIGYKGDPLAEPFSTKEKFDDLAKKYAQEKGHDAIAYTEGTFGEPELHVFGKEQPPKVTVKAKVLKGIADKKPTGGDVLRSLAIAGTYGVETDDDGNPKINPVKFLLGLAGGMAGAMVLNPNIRAKLAKAIGKDVSKLSDEQLVNEYKTKFGEAINVRKPNDKMYVENVRIDKFDNPEKIIQAVTGLSKEEILSARRKLDDVQIEKLAKEEQPLIDDIRAGKIEKGRAYNAPQIQRISSEMAKIVEEKGMDETKFSPEEKNIVQVMLGMTYESGLAQREFTKGVTPEVANFFRKFDPDAPIKEKVPPGVLMMLAEFSGAMKLASGSGLIRSAVGNSFMRALYKPEVLLTSQYNKLLSLLPGLKNKPRNRYLEEAMYGDIVKKQTAKDGLKTGIDIFLGRENAIAQNAFLQSEGYSVEGAIPGKFGKIVRTPYRAQGAIDAIFRMPIRDIEISRMAIRKAIQDKKFKTPEEVINAAQKYFDEAPEEWIKRADDLAKYRTFQNVGGSNLQRFNKWRSEPGAKLIFPFFTTNANMAKMVVEHSPFSPLTPSFFQALWEATTKKDVTTLTQGQKSLGRVTGREFDPGQFDVLSEKLARMTAGTAVLGGMALVADQVLQGNLTADYPKSEKLRRLWELEGRIPFGFKIPGFGWMGYSGFEPFSSYATGLAQYYQNKEERALSPEEEATWLQKMTRLGTGLIKSYSENPSMVGIKYITEGFFEEGDFGAKAESAVAGFVTGLVIPTIVKQTTNVIDPRARKPDGIPARITSQLPIVSKYVKGRKNVFSEPVKISHPASRYLGVSISPETEDKVNKEIASLGIVPLPPSEMYAGLKLNESQVEELQLIAGINLKAVLKQLVEADGWKKYPKQIKIDLVNKVKQNIYDVQREVLFPTKQAEGKINKLPEFEGGISAEEKAEWMELIQGQEK